MGNVCSNADFTDQSLQQTPFADAEVLQYREIDLLDEKWYFENVLKFIWRY